MKKVLVVGGEGYIGNVVCSKLLNSGYKVISYDNFIYNNYYCALNKVYQKNFKFVFGDISNTPAIKPLIEESDVVLLLAGLVGDPITKR